MQQIGSSQFRTSYLILAEPTEVRVGRRIIGSWYPVGSSPQPGLETLARVAKMNPPDGKALGAAFRPMVETVRTVETLPVKPPVMGMTQAERDAVLRKMTKPAVQR